MRSKASPMCEGYPTSLQIAPGRSVPFMIKKSARRNGAMALKLLPEGVVLTVPPSVSPAKAQAFLCCPDSQRWLQERVASNPYLGLPPYTGRSGWEAPLAGRIIPVVWHDAPVGRACILEGDEAIHAFAPPSAPDALLRSIVRDALLARMRQDLAPLLARWLPTIPGGSVSRMSITPMRSRWGSMSSSHRLSLSSFLVGVRPSALEYVLIHELCHQIHMNHSPAFWREVKSRCPHYRQEEAHLKQEGLKVRSLMGRIKP